MACPLTTLTVPIGVPLSKNVTAPVSPDPVGGNTVAVKVTGWPATEGLAEVRSPRLVGCPAHRDRRGLADELATKPGAPPYEAVTESEPTGSVVTSMLAVVTPSVVDNSEVPSVVPSSVKVTVPSGFDVPEVGVTVAVSVIALTDVDAGGDGTMVVVVDIGATLSTMVADEVAKLASPLYVTVMLCMPSRVVRLGARRLQR